eukprot:6015004-Amphidinium_carterae.2
MLEPKKVLAFVYNNVYPSFKLDMEMNMEWINMKNVFKVTHKSFDHKAFDKLLQELVVKLRMRKNIARVDQALEPGARSIEAEANESRTLPKPKKKALTPPPRRKLCSSYASAKGCFHGELCPLFKKGGHSRMHNKCLRCGLEEHLVKSCTRATQKREA